MLWRSGMVLISTMAWTSYSHCFGQGSTKFEDTLPQGIRNRSDVQPIVKKLLFLRLNEANFGENHLKKESTRAQIRECEYELNRIVELSTSSTQSDVSEGSINAEDALPRELQNRPEVQSLVYKLRFMRMNEKYFGENHPSKKLTKEQIRQHESALKKIVEQENLPSPQSADLQNSTIAQDELSLKLDDRPEVQLLIQKVLFLRINLVSFGENHPNRKSVQDQIQKYEATLASQLDLLPRPTSPTKSSIRQRTFKASELMASELQNSKEVRMIVQKLAVLRLNEANFGENHPNWNFIQTEIRELEFALREIIMLDQNANRKSNPIQPSPNGRH